MMDPTSKPQPASADEAEAGDYYVDTTENINMPSSNSNRRSKLFCGVADFRTATVVLNVMHVAFVVFLAIVLIFMYLIEGGPFLGQNLLATIGSAIFAICVSVAGLHGAMNWKLRYLYGSIVGWIILIAVRLWAKDWLDLTVAIVMVYPHVMLSQEIRSGVLSVETFHEEEFVADGGREFVQIAHGYVVTSFSPNAAASPSASAEDKTNNGGGFSAMA